MLFSFFFNDPATPELYTLSLHDALPIFWRTWLNEVARIDPADPRPEPWYVNAQIFRFFMPWTVWFSLGLITAAVSLRSEEHTSELQSQSNLVCRLLLEKKKNTKTTNIH